jgi:hypothetical protein
MIDCCYLSNVCVDIVITVLYCVLLLIDYYDSLHYQQSKRRMNKGGSNCCCVDVDVVEYRWMDGYLLYQADVLHL